MRGRGGRRLAIDGRWSSGCEESNGEGETTGD
jgi:hypothetical protein